MIYYKYSWVAQEMANFHDTSTGNTRNGLVGIDIFNIILDNLEKKRKCFQFIHKFIFLYNQQFRGKNENPKNNIFRRNRF